MARLAVIVVLALAAFAAAGFASADTTTPTGEIRHGDTASEAAAAALPAFGPTASDDQIGTADDDGDAAPAPDDSAATEAPVGGDVPPGAFPPTPADSPNSGAADIEVAALTGVAVFSAVASCFF